MIEQDVWRTIGFQPAPPGWRVWWLWLEDDRPRTSSQALAGWLVMEKARQNGIGYVVADDNVEPGDRRRWVVAAIHERGGGEGLDEAREAWMVLGPGDPEPDQKEIEQGAELERRRVAAAARRRLERQRQATSS